MQATEHSSFPKIPQHSNLKTHYLHLDTVCTVHLLEFYRVNIKYFPDYKHLLQENYME